MKLSELIAAVGDENIQVQELDECVKGAVQRNGHVEVSFETTGVSVAEVATGKYRNRGLIIWLPVERLPKT